MKIIWNTTFMAALLLAADELLPRRFAVA